MCEFVDEHTSCDRAHVVNFRIEIEMGIGTRRLACIRTAGGGSSVCGGEKGEEEEAEQERRRRRRRRRRRKKRRKKAMLTSHDQVYIVMLHLIEMKIPTLTKAFRSAFLR